MAKTETVQRELLKRLPEGILVDVRRCRHYYAVTLMFDPDHRPKSDKPPPSYRIPAGEFRHRSSHTIVLRVTRSFDELNSGRQPAG